MSNAVVKVSLLCDGDAHLVERLVYGRDVFRACAVVGRDGSLYWRDRPEAVLP